MRTASSLVMIPAASAGALLRSCGHFAAETAADPRHNDASCPQTQEAEQGVDGERGHDGSV